MIVLLVAAIGARRWAPAAVVWLAVGVGAMCHDFAPHRTGPIPFGRSVTFGLGCHFLR